MHARLLAKPPSPEAPWNLILYSDEVTPGNPLSPANHRKYQAIYWSFLEFGPPALSREEGWFTLLCEYSKTVNRAHAGLSQVFGEVLKLFFDPNGFNLMTGGMPLPFENDELRLWAKLGVVLQDGGARQYVLHRFFLSSPYF